MRSFLLFLLAFLATIIPTYSLTCPVKPTCLPNGIVAEQLVDTGRDSNGCHHYKCCPFICKRLSATQLDVCPACCPNIDPTKCFLNAVDKKPNTCPKCCKVPPSRFRCPFGYRTIKHTNACPTYQCKYFF
jgi:hypothetical protein